MSFIKILVKLLSYHTDMHLQLERVQRKKKKGFAVYSYRCFSFSFLKCSAQTISQTSKYSQFYLVHSTLYYSRNANGRILIALFKRIQRLQKRDGSSSLLPSSGARSNKVITKTVQLLHSADQKPCIVLFQCMYFKLKSTWILTEVTCIGILLVVCSIIFQGTEYIVLAE